MKCSSECDGDGYKKISAISCAICERCGGTGEVKETNFDRITASPKALAEYVVSLEYDKEDFPNSYKEDYDNLLEWLKQESEQQ